MYRKKKKGKKMQQQEWEIFENKCAEYLNSTYSLKLRCIFEQSGGHNSHEPDIYVNKNGKELFSMETKMPVAQCGQFVLFPDDVNEKFVYSSRNEFPINKYSKRIIAEMEKHYSEYNTPSTKPLNFDKQMFYDWVKNHYKNERGSRYLITQKDDFIIFNIDNFEKYYDISAVFRVKKSGSANPSKSDMDEIQLLLNVGCIKFKNLRTYGHYVEVELPFFNSDKLVRTGGKYDFQLKRTEGCTFRITKLSTTYNANVIFSINLLNEQRTSDLDSFIREISSK